MNYRVSVVRTALFVFVLLHCPRSQGAEETELLPSAEQTSVARRSINETALRGHIRFLADDLLEGRAPDSRGDQLAQRYIAAQFESLGLRPAAPGGGWYQEVPLVGVTSHVPDVLTLKNAADTVQLRRHHDYVMWSGKPADQTAIEDAEFVFVGYGIVAPEYDWDDYKDVDLSGKILLMMNNDPSEDPDLFAGSRRLYYGRWDYKYEMAAQRGAAGAVIIHTTRSAGYPYQVVQSSWVGEEFELHDQQGPRMEVKAWFTEDAARRLVEISGYQLDRLRAMAQRRDFHPVALGTRTTVRLKCEVRKKQTANVLGLLPGSDPELAKEMIVYMAHHDHIGVAAERDERGDNIYNGAVDNASGVAALLTIARAYMGLTRPPARSILFTTVGAEEQGLLGSAYMSHHPPAPPGYIAAVLNIDSVNVLGPTRDVNVIGHGKSSMDEIVQRIAAWQGRVVTPDQFPDRGYYYRSDQFSLAKIGVPGVYLHSGVHVIGKPDGWGKSRLEEWIETTYHQLSDEYRDDWDLRGAVSDTHLLFYCGLQAAEAAELPHWTPGDEFEAARKQALDARPK